MAEEHVDIHIRGDARSGVRETNRSADALENLGRSAEDAAAKSHVATEGMTKDLRGLSAQMHDTDRHSVTLGNRFNNLGGAIMKSNRNFLFFRNLLTLLKWPALIAGAGAAAQAISALGAGVVGLTSALAPLTGALAALPALYGAIGQAAGVVALAGIKDLTQAMQGNEEALKRLSPQAVKFMHTLQSFTPEYKRLKAAVQTPLFKGLEEGIRAAARNFPVLQRVLGDTARTMGNLAARAGQLLGSRAFGRDFQRIGEGNARLLNRLGVAGLHLASALRHVMVAAQPLITWIGRLAVKWTDAIDAQAKAGRESGRLEHFFRQTRATMERLFSITGHLASGLYEIGKAAAPLGRSILAALNQSAAGFERWTKSIRGRNELAQYFHDARPAIFETGRLIGAIGKAFFSLANTPGLTLFIRQLRTDVLPALTQMIRQTTVAFGPALGRFVVELAKLLGTFAGATGPLTMFVNALTGLLRIVNALPGPLKSLFVTMASLLAIFKAMRVFAAFTGLEKALPVVARFVGLQGAMKGMAVATNAEAAAMTRLGAATTEANLAGMAGGLGRVPAMTTVGREAGAAASGGFLATLGTRIRTGLKTIKWGRIGGLSLGIALAQGVFEEFSAQTELHSGDFRRELRAKLNPTKLREELEGTVKIGGRGLLGMLGIDTQIDWNPFIDGMGDSRKAAQALAGQLRRVGTNFNTLSDARRGYIARLAAESGQTEKARRMLDRYLNGLQRVGDGIRSLRNEFGQTMPEIRQKVQQNMQAIQASMGANTRQGKDAVARNFQAAIHAIRNSMDAGRIATDKGLKTINQLMKAQLRQYGVKDPQALLSETQARKGLAGAKGYAAGAGGGRGGGRHQKGGMVVPGHGSGDKIPLTALVEPGERVFVLNRNASEKLDQLKAFNAAVPRFQRGGVPGDTGGLKAGEMALMRLVTGRFGGSVSSGLRPGDTGSLHSTGQAADWVGGNWAGAATFFNQVGRLLLEGIYTGAHGGPAVSWDSGHRVPPSFWAGDWAPHSTHIHSAISDASARGLGGARLVGGAAGGIQLNLPRFIAGAPVMVSFAKGLNDMSQMLEDRASQLGGFGGFTGPWKSVMAQIARAKGWNLGDWMELVQRESGGDPGARNPSSGAFGLGQFLGGTAQAYAKYGALSHDPVKQIQAMAKYISDRYGTPTKALAWHDAHNWYRRGGEVGLQRGGEAHLVDALAVGPFLRDIAGEPDAGNRSNIISRYVQTIKDLGISGNLTDRLGSLSTAADQYLAFADRAQAISSGEETDAQKAFRGMTEAGWLDQQLTALFQLRNVILAAAKAIQDKLLKRIRELLQTLRDRLREIKREREVLQAQIDKAKNEDTQGAIEQAQKALEDARRIRDPDRRRAAVKQAEANLAKAKKGKEGRRDLIDSLTKQLRPVNRQYDALNKVIPALTQRRSDAQAQLAGLLGDGGEGWKGLTTIQGPAGPMNKMERVPNAEAITVFGGEIGDAALRMVELGAQTSGASVDGTALADFYKEQAQTLARQLGLAQAQARVFQNYFQGRPYIGAYQEGGYIDRTGMALVHKGETVVPAGDGGQVVIYLSGDLAPAVSAAAPGIARSTDQWIGKRSRRLIFSPGR